MIEIGANHHRLVLRSRRVVTPGGVRPADIVIREERIAAIEPHSSQPEPVEDAGEDVVMPGLVDIHVHINQPGRTKWEGFETATRAALAGGITTLVDMPLNSTPVTTSAAALRAKVSEAEGRIWVDCAFHGGLVPDNADRMKELIEAGVVGIKAFMIDSGIEDFPPVREADFDKAMPILAAHGVPLLVHAESYSATRLPNPDLRSYRRYLASRPPEWETMALVTLLRGCREHRCPIHVVHLSSQESLKLLEASKAEGLPVTVETCPHYLTFDADQIPDGDTRFKCAPPIREARHREALWKALREGVIDFLASDHSPCPPEMKQLETGDFEAAWGGISSLQFLLPAVWTEARKRGFGFVDVSEWLSRRPAERVGLTDKGRIVAGAQADLVVWKPETDWTLDQRCNLHRHKVTPYDHRRFFGRVMLTLLRGQVVSRLGWLGGPAGRVLLRRAED